MIDYLETWPDVDASRIDAQGISMGGWTAPRDDRPSTLQDWMMRELRADVRELIEQPRRHDTIGDRRERRG